MTLNISTNVEGFIIFVMPTQHKHSAHVRSAAQTSSLAYKRTKTQQLINTQRTNLQTQKLINSSTCKPKNSQTDKHINSRTYKLKNLNRYFLFYNSAQILSPF